MPDDITLTFAANPRSSHAVRDGKKHYWMLDVMTGDGDLWGCAPVEMFSGEIGRRLRGGESITFILTEKSE